LSRDESAKENARLAELDILELATATLLDTELAKERFSAGKKLKNERATAKQMGTVRNLPARRILFFITGKYCWFLE
jgi:hypothetical protein